jgi:uncharacterized protein YoxC
MTQETLAASAVAIVITVVGFFLVRTLHQVDKKLDETASDVKKVGADVGELKTGFKVWEFKTLKLEEEVAAIRSQLQFLGARIDALDRRKS